VAIKLLPLEISVDQDFGDRFVREARAMARLNHPNIITVHDFGTTSEGHLYFVMEYVEGANLADVIHQTGLDGDQALSIVEQCCTALAYAHGKGIVHRDIKPANVMIDTESHVKVADFGLARLIDPSAEQFGHTMTGTVMGTPDYMAPEQMKGMNVDHRADIYSLGVMVYEMLCREVPRGIFHPPSQRTGCDQRIDQIVTRAMQQAPEHRYQSTQEMKADVVAARVPVEGVSPRTGDAPMAGGDTGPTPPKRAPLPLPKKPATPGSPGRPKPLEPESLDSGQATEIDSQPPSPPKPAVMKAIPLPPPRKPRLPLYGGLAAGLLALGIVAAVLVPKLGGTRSVVSPTSPNASEKAGADGPAPYAAQPEATSPSPSPEPWQDVLHDPSKLRLFKGAERTPEGLRLTDVTGVIVRTDRGSSRDAAVRMRTTFGGLRVELHARSCKGGVYQLLTWNERTIRLTGWDNVAHESTVLRDFPLPAALQPGQDYALELRAVGQVLTARFNGGTLGSVTDASYAEGTLGVGVTAHSGTPSLVKSLEVLDLDAPEAASVTAATKEAPYVNTLGMKFVLVPITGGPTDGQRVLFSVWDTRIQDYEVFAKETKREWPKPEFEQGQTHPAVMVSWDDAQAFCQWLTQREHNAGRLPAALLYRLPSDHEWSCAVDLGSREDAAKLPSEKSGKISAAFPWDGDWPPPKGAGNYAGEELQATLATGKYATVKGTIAGYNDGFENTSPVESFPANRFGLYDMGGNVQQWCEDWSDENRQEHVLRGASWGHSDRYSLLLSNRTRYPASSRYSYSRGFRCVIAPVAASTASPFPAGDVTPATATRETPFVNGLEMKFVPVPIVGGPTNGQRVLFSVWDTRVQDYEVFAKETKREWPKPEFEQGQTHPAVMVSWDDATAFCQWLSERERKAGRLIANEAYRLPSDHEWSCAVGIGDREDATKLPGEKSQQIGDAFPWGTQWPPPKGAGNYAGEELQSALAAGKFGSVGHLIAGYKDGFVDPSPVGSFSANRFGLYDMGGNVAQWCEDWHDKEQKDRVQRGASRLSANRLNLLSSYRGHAAPDFRNYNNGFRCVLAPSFPASSDGHAGARPSDSLAAAAGTIHLLPLVDPRRDAIKGTWSMTADGLVLETPPQHAVLELPYEPAEEYDFEIEFTPTGGGLNPNMYLRAQGRSLTWKLNAEAVTPPLYGFEMLDGKFIKDLREAAASNPLRIEAGQRHTTRVEVRRTGLRGIVDGVEFVKWSGDFQRFAMEEMCKLRNERALGVGSYRRGIIFHRIDVREVTGTGKVLSASVSAERLPMERWQNALRDPAELSLSGGVELVPEGLRLSHFGSVIIFGHDPDTQRDGAVRLQAAFGGVSPELRARRRHGAGVYFLRVRTDKLVSLGRWDEAANNNTYLREFPLREPLKAGQDYELELRVVGQTFTAKLNGEVLGTVTDGTYPQGHFGVGLSERNDSPVLVKTLEVLDLDAKLRE
jgi:serine/threonine protein kinase/formylglycine-generating enzyme required for sulfatase activity